MLVSEVQQVLARCSPLSRKRAAAVFAWLTACWVDRYGSTTCTRRCWPPRMRCSRTGLGGRRFERREPWSPPRTERPCLGAVLMFWPGQLLLQNCPHRPAGSCPVHLYALGRAAADPLMWAAIANTLWRPCLAALLVRWGEQMQLQNVLHVPSVSTTRLAHLTRLKCFSRLVLTGRCVS